MTGTYVKSVSFDNLTRVVLIPPVQEYKDAKIDHDVWYTYHEMQKLRKKYIEELSYNGVNLQTKNTHTDTHLDTHTDTDTDTDTDTHTDTHTETPKTT